MTVAGPLGDGGRELGSQRGIPATLPPDRGEAHGGMLGMRCHWAPPPPLPHVSGSATRGVWSPCDRGGHRDFVPGCN